MKVHQFLTSFSYGDAIGNEALEIRNYLRDLNHESEIFAQFYHPRYADQIINYLEYYRYSDPQCIVIYHFSIGSPVTKKFIRLPDKKVIIYHNITPYHFFLDYHRILAKDCFKGRIELKTLADKVDLALGDSSYNELELRELGFPKTGVLPLVMDFTKFDQPKHPVLPELYQDNKTNITFVGRVIPNKKVEDVIKTFALYKKYFNPHSRLFIVGEYRGFERYLSALQQLIRSLALKDIHFTGHIPNDELITYLKLSHLYLHLSEHEGFCAPIPECFYLKIPVLAFNGGAVSETMNQGGLLIQKKDFMEIAALMDHVLNTPALKQQLIETQQNALQKYFRQNTGEILIQQLKAVNMN